MAQQKRKATSQPVSVIKHPMFPAVVALWFGALFGLGSLAIRPGLIESLVLKLHIDTLVPAAAPPLGVTARICMALVLAVLGGMLGTKLARFMGRARPEDHQRKRDAAGLGGATVRTRDSHPDAPARRPFSAHDEIGAQGLANEAEAGLLPGRRRALTTEASTPDAEFAVPNLAPLPGGNPQIFDLGALDLVAEDEAGVEPLAQDPVADEHRQLFGHPVQPEQPFGAPIADFAPMRETAPQADDTPLPVYEFAKAPPFAALAEPVVAETVEVSADPAAAVPSVTAAAVAEAAAVALDSLGLVELTERFAATLRQRRAALAASVAVVELPVEAPVAITIEDSEPEEFQAELELPPVAAATEEEMVAEELAPESVGAEAAAGPIAAEVAPMPLPAALRPLNFDLYQNHDDDAEDEDYASYLPLRQIRMPQANPQPAVAAPVADAAAVASPEFDPFAPMVGPFASLDPIPATAQPTVFSAPAATAAVAEFEAEPAQEDGYSSLLNIGQPNLGQQTFVRVEEPEITDAEIEPVVIFPGQAARQTFGQNVGQESGSANVVLGSFTPPVDAAATPLRSFDAPGSAQAGQPVAVTGQAQLQDPVETERALRAALATLQRMSGAA